MKIAVAGGTGTVGRHLVRRARERGHEVVVLSRAAGVDVRKGDGLAEALSGVDTIVDVTNPGGEDYAHAAEFFTEVATTLGREGAARGVAHVVTLSVVGIEATTFDYFRAKLAHERAAAAAGVPATLLRATQLHEFPAQLLAMTRHGGQASVFDWRVRTVAADTVAEVLLELAEAGPVGRAPDLAGPETAGLVELAREFARHRGQELTVSAVPGDQTGVPDGALLPGPGARVAGPTYREWLVGEHAAALEP